jgi:hypothetical protein
MTCLRAATNGAAGARRRADFSRISDGVRQFFAEEFAIASAQRCTVTATTD